ncbi:MAG: YchJ family metal-binding protein [Legionellaceae bacterium]|nr:YchJ family metal-binding protein [Legionellaceae bacterium]
MTKCACGSQRDYDQCCQPYVTGQATPKTPEALMRSRYTAYTLADIAYIEKTQRGKAAEGFHALDAYVWAKRVTWLNLEVVNTSLKSPQKGTVEFIARFIDAGVTQSMHEKSEFIKKAGQWFYVDGVHVP